MIGMLLGNSVRWNDETLAVLNELVIADRPHAAEHRIDFAACELRGLLRRPEDEAGAS